MKKFGALVLLLVLAACAGGDKTGDAGKDTDDAKPVAQKMKTDNLICPQVAILQEAEEVFDYGGEDPDPSELVSKSRMKNIDGTCAYRKNGIDILFTVRMVAARGPRLGGSHAEFPYFIAVADPADHVLSREVMTAAFTFSGADKVAGDDEALHVFIPLSKTALLSGPDYRVLVGFQMRKEQRKAEEENR